MLSPYHSDRNPIELILADIKGYVASRNTTCSFSTVWTICEGKFASTGAQVWLAKCEHIKKLEEEYMARKGGINVLVESSVISLESDSDSEFEISKEDDSDSLSGIKELV